MAAPLDLETRKALANRIDAVGVQTAARELGITVTTVARALAALPVQVGSATHIRTHFAAAPKAA